ncbi:hypothetical protein [Cucumibacter marinus]|uniref:hypothetical protein n=1 Tax=Cucumibacter marinus TaxID=1121252 RepID=UPI00041806CA|nr:hypothetical protein [Cucumibacter marinus]
MHIIDIKYPAGGHENRSVGENAIIRQMADVLVRGSVMLSDEPAVRACLLEAGFGPASIRRFGDDALDDARRAIIHRQATPELRAFGKKIIQKHMVKALMASEVDLEDTEAVDQRLREAGFGESSILHVGPRARTEAAARRGTQAD